LIGVVDNHQNDLAHKTKQKMKTIVNDPLIVIEASNYVVHVPKAALPSSNIFEQLKWNLDLIDFV
jgi:hypothetical protein